MEIPTGSDEKYCHDHAELQPCKYCAEIDAAFDDEPQPKQSEITKEDLDEEFKSITELHKPVALPVCAGFTDAHKPVTDQFLDRVRACLAGELTATGYAIRDNEWGIQAIKEILTVQAGDRITLTFEMTTKKGT